MMATVVATHGSLIEMEEIENSRESILNLLESQKGYFQSQIKQFHRIVNHQCKLTGSNPLAQDMAASSLGNKTGKYLNPKAMKYLQSVFSIKDTIGKKEARKISSLCGTTVTQVRNFIATECSKVKKLVEKSKNLPITNKMKTEPEPGNGLKLLISSSDTLSKKHELSNSATKTKEGRKVQMLVEHPDGKSGRNRPIIAKASSSNQSRPNIKKAEMRAIYMQEKHGKAAKSPTEHGQLNDENIPHAVRKPLLNNQAPPTFNAPRVQIQWCRPPEVLLSSSWHVCSGQNSKELHNEIKRTQTRQESIYQTAHQIPPNPKQPWGSEIDYNDALTPVIPIEEHANVTANGTMPAALDFSNVDLDLLKVLLKNPELVEVLTRVEHNLTQEQLVALLEYVKKANFSQPVPISRSASIPRPNLPVSNNQGQQPLPLPMQVMYQPNHTNMMSSNYNLENLFPGTVQYPEQLPHLTVPDYSRSEFEMYRRGRGYDQSNLNYGNLNNGNRVGEKRLQVIGRSIKV